MMLLRANVLSKGKSGVRAPLVETLLDAFVNRRVHPVIPAKGSVGASGDLAPLAHLALPSLAKARRSSAGTNAGSEALSKAGIAPLVLEAKEGLALLNGTQAMGAVGGLAVLRAQRVSRLCRLGRSDGAGGVARNPCSLRRAHPPARPHAGQIASGRASAPFAGRQRNPRLASYRRSPRAGRLQFALHAPGPWRGAGRLAHARECSKSKAARRPITRLYSARRRGRSSAGGNFHGAPLAMALDYAAIAVTDLMSISERSIDRLVNPDGTKVCPPFSARNRAFLPVS